MIKPEIKVVKASGKRDTFSVDKLKHSLKKSGASVDVINEIVDKVKESLYDEISTKEIYKKAFELLRKNSRPTAARYKLKKAIMELGPSGFPFEKFVSEILKHEGFKTNIGVIVKGHCVNHEVDVVAEKEHKHYLIECKFHNDSGRFSDVKIPLYIHSRFRDIDALWQKHPDNKTKFQQGWIYTNTRFTADAMEYGNCAGLKLVSWDYPKNNSLKEQIDKAKLHPITCLTTLTNNEKQKLLSGNNVLCVDIYNQPDLLNSIGINNKIRQNKILFEVHELCGK